MTSSEYRPNLERSREQAPVRIIGPPCAIDPAVQDPPVRDYRAVLPAGWLLVRVVDDVCAPTPTRSEPVTTTGSQATLAIADSMTSVTASGWEIMITCEPSSSVMVAPARSA